MIKPISTQVIEIKGQPWLTGTFEIDGFEKAVTINVLVDGRSLPECKAELMDTAEDYLEFKRSGHVGTFEEWLADEIESLRTKLRTMQ